jgi:hypothetical protein
MGFALHAPRHSEQVFFQEVPSQNGADDQGRPFEGGFDDLQGWTGGASGDAESFPLFGGAGP